MSDDDDFTGRLNANDISSEFNAQYFAIWSILNRINTATLVQVKKVTNTGTDIPAGFVDVLPLVNMVDGDGASRKHGIVYKCPYLRIMGGNNAVILDPQVGDIGLMCFASRDISSVVKVKGQANPGSFRKFDYADGIYVGGVLGAANPTQYVQFNSDGIKIADANGHIIQMSSTGVEITGDVIVNGTVGITGGLVAAPGHGTTINMAGDISLNGTLASNGQISSGSHTLTSHTHSDPQGGSTGGPTG